MKGIIWRKTKSLSVRWLLLLAGLCAIWITSGQEPVYAEPMQIIDEHTDLTKIFEKVNVANSSSKPHLYNGDGSRMYKLSHSEAYVIYKVPNDNVQQMTGFRIDSWYHYTVPGHTPGDMQFAVSADNMTYTAYANVAKTIILDPPPQSGWHHYIWEADNLPVGTRYLKIIYGNTTPHPESWSVQLGRTVIEIEDNMRDVLEYELEAAAELLNTPPGTMPGWATDALEAAIQAGWQVANDPNAGESDYQLAYDNVRLAMEQFLASQIYNLNWPEAAAITAASSGLTQLTLSWPQVTEHAAMPDTVYRLYRNDELAATVTGTTYTITGLRPQTAYSFHVIAGGSGGDSPVLGPVELATDDVPPVPAVDLSTLNVNDFDDTDFIRPQTWVNDVRSMLYYFKHFSTVANAVRLDEPNRGYIDIVVHRSPAKNNPYNARVQENHLWLAYFYTHQAPWNLYYGMPEVKIRLEAVLEHLLLLQNSTGAFSVDSWGQSSLAGTSFAVQYMGQTVRLLQEAKAANPAFVSIDEDLFDRLVASYRKGLWLVMDSEAFWTHGSKYTNQYTLIWSSAAAYLAYYPDAQIEQKMRDRFAASAASFISPAGFYYEHNSYDMGYNLGVHFQNMMADYYYFKDTDLDADMLDTESAFIEWLTYNMVIEPDGSFFTTNSAPASRTGSSHIERKDLPLAEKLPIARAFVKTQEEVAAEIAAGKADLTTGTLDYVPPLSLNGENSYNPYGLYNRIMYRYYPTETERAAAIGQLPYMASDRFNHQRVDSASRSGLEFTYVRRPNYYATFNAGTATASTQAFGLGLVWHPDGGIMISSQSEHSTATSTRDLSWGTRADSNVRVYESGNVNPAYQVNGLAHTPTVGYGDLAAGEVSLSYSLGTSGGSKTVAFAENGLQVEVSHAGAFTEQIPLIIKDGDVIDVQQGIVTVTRGDVVMTVSFDGTATAAVTPRSFNIFGNQLQMLTLAASGSLDYSITLSVTE
ncbi:MAG: hypothetical protein K0R57_3804 [Paenibacillaceae bacterium]|nr:hypothetical protein [Paenibacillaceae bacterium]